MQQRQIARQMLGHLQKLVGTPVLYYIAGPGTGSMLDLHFGKRIPRPHKLENAYLSEEQRTTEGEVSLFVSCAWRLDGPEAIAAGCWDDNEEGGEMQRGLAQIVGVRLKRFELVPPAFDLALAFASGHVLRLFCDQTNDFEGGDNYSLFSGSTIYTVANRSELQTEPRHESDPVTPSDD